MYVFCSKKKRMNTTDKKDSVPTKQNAKVFDLKTPKRSSFNSQWLKLTKRLNSFDRPWSKRKDKTASTVDGQNKKLQRQW